MEVVEEYVDILEQLLKEAAAVKGKAEVLLARKSAFLRSLISRVGDAKDVASRSKRISLLVCECYEEMRCAEWWFMPQCSLRDRMRDEWRLECTHCLVTLIGAVVPAPGNNVSTIPTRHQDCAPACRKAGTCTQVA